MTENVDNNVGLCLDVDGTLYRRGSVFVEALPWLTGAAWTRSTDRAHLRAAVAAVMRHYGGSLRGMVTRGLLSAVDSLRMLGCNQTAKAALKMLSQLSGPHGNGNTYPHRNREREHLHKLLLSEYGAAVADRPVTIVRRSLATVFHDRHDGAVPSLPDRLVTTLSEIATDDVSVALVTDAPAHVAQAFTESTAELNDAVSVVGTQYDRVDGIFTGDFTRIDKGEVITELADRQGWDWVIAGGDTTRDLAMAQRADRFIAVEGHGDIRRWAETEGTAEATRDTRATFVPYGQQLSPVLRRIVNEGQ